MSEDLTPEQSHALYLIDRDSNLLKHPVSDYEVTRLFAWAWSNEYMKRLKGRLVLTDAGRAALADAAVKDLAP